MWLFSKAIIVFMFALAIFPCLVSGAVSQSPNLDPILLLPGQSMKIPLLPLISSPNASFFLSQDSPSYATLTNFLLSNFSVNITGVPSNPTAVAVSQSSLAFIDQSFTLYTGSYEQDSSTITLNSTNYPISPDSICTSIILFDNYFLSPAITCSELSFYKQEDIEIHQGLYNSVSSHALLPYLNLPTMLIPKVSSYNLTDNAANIVWYFNYNESPVICNYYHQMSGNSIICDYLPNLSSIETVQTTSQSNLLFADNGQVYSFKFLEPSAANIQLNFLGNLTDSIIQSCNSNQGSTIVAFSNTTLYYFSNSSFIRSYSIPQGFNPQSCVIDSRTYSLFLIAQANQDLITHIFVYLLTDDLIRNILADVPLTTATGEVLAASPGQSPGQIVLLFSNNLLTLTFSEPILLLDNVQESSTFSILYQNSQEIIPINVTVLTNAPEIYPNSNTATQIVSFEPGVNIQDYFLGPALGTLSENNSFFGGVYGPCAVSNFEDLNLSQYQPLYFKTLVPSDLNIYSNNNSLYATIVYIYYRYTTYVEVAFNNPYFQQGWDPTNSCNLEVQILSTYSMTYANSNCFFGPYNDICEDHLDYIYLDELTKQRQSSDEGRICIEAGTTYFLIGTYFNVFVCINEDFWGLFGGFLGTYLVSNQFSFGTFSPNLVTMFQPSSSTAFFVVSYPGGLAGFEFFEDFNPSFQTKFQMQLNYSNNSFIQLTQNRLIYADFDANLIMEWDMSDPSNPFFIGNYVLYSFKLDPTMKPVYYPDPNHLIFSAFNGSVPYFLVFQPGNMAPSTLLYAINLEDFLTSEMFGSSMTASNANISIIYSPINHNTMFFAFDGSNLRLFWASSSPYAYFNETTQEQSGCLYCSGNSTLSVSSSLLQSSPSEKLSKSVSYVKISSEQPIAIQNPSSLEYDIHYEEPLYILPPSCFQGTILDYNVSNIIAYVFSLEFEVLNVNVPINLAQSLQLNLSLQNSQNFEVQISTFCDGTRVYGLSSNISWYVDLEPPFQIQIINLTNLSSTSLTFIAGASDSSQNQTAFAYSNQTSWGVYSLTNGANFSIPEPIVKIKVVGSLVFALVQSGFNLIYILNCTENTLDFITLIQKELLSFNPLDFSVENLSVDLYGIVIVDGSDTIRSIIFNASSGIVLSQLTGNFTPNVQNDLPQETLQIIAIQSMTRTLQNQLSIIEYVLYVQNFHSYQMQIIYGQDINIGNVTKCFVQMPGHASLGYGITTDFYFLDIKTINGFYYLYSYPLNLTYDSNGGQSGEYPYLKPIHRQIFDDPQNIAMSAMNGENGIAFVAIYTPAYGYTPTQNVSIQIYNLGSQLEIGFNQNLEYQYVSDYDLNQINLTVGNDAYSMTIQFTLHTRNFTRSPYFIVLMCFVGTTLAGVCYYIVRRDKKKSEARG